MTVIVPRWEWRTFGERFDSAEARFAALPPERVQTGDELYILSRQSDASVKVRDGLMDVKLQRRVVDGLEQWEPVLKTPFPLAPTDVETVLSALGLEAPVIERDSTSLEQLLDEIVRPHPGLMALAVHKTRNRFTIGGCMAELTDIQADGKTTRTIAVEFEDPALVKATVGELGLGSHENVCMARGLKALVGFGARRYAVVDVGTNSVKFLIGELEADGSWRTIDDRAVVTRLGKGLDETGLLSEESVEHTVDAIVGMTEEARRDGVIEIAAVGTAGLRVATNSADLVDAVRERCGVHVEVIPGEEEARLAYVATMEGLGLADGSLVVFDTGGGSSQFTFGHGEHVDERFSVHVGAARFTEQFALHDPVSEQQLAAALDAIAGELDCLDGRPTPDALVGMGGTVTNLTAVMHELDPYDPDVVRGTVLEAAEVDRQIELFRTRTADERRRLPGLQPARAGIILAGACIVRTVLTKLGSDSLTVSDRGLRHRLIVEMFGAG